VNSDDIGSSPTLLGVAVALAALAALAVALTGAVRQRRRDLALLKALGSTRRQLSAAVAWQATATMAVGLAVGVPLGVVAGRVLWGRFANQLDVPADPAIPLGLIAAVMLGALVAANMLSALPARYARAVPVNLVLNGVTGYGPNRTARVCNADQTMAAGRGDPGQLGQRSVGRPAQPGVRPERTAALIPAPQRLEREDPGGVPVVPGDDQAPGPMEVRALDPQRHRAPRPRPGGLASVAQGAAGGARTGQAQRHQVERRYVPVEEGDRHALVPGDVDRLGFVPLIHTCSLPRGRDVCVTST
jgi:hypothetical protein